MTATDAMRLRHYPLLRSGKVRDIYDAGDSLLLVATDRLSAFDVILPTVIPEKGRLLTAIATYWFDMTSHICPNHLVTTDISTLDLSVDERERLDGRTMVGKKARRIDIECVVRGYLAGSGYKEYKEAGTLAGERLPSGLQLGDALPELRFTPAIKNDHGHDENVSRQQLASQLGPEVASKLEKISLDIFAFASRHAAKAGFILADTKFEFGWLNDEIILIDEILTPDSSRYWDASNVEPGMEPPSFDKQLIRDWLEFQQWDKTSPGPIVPAEIVREAGKRYAAVYQRLISIKEGQE